MSQRKFAGHACGKRMALQKSPGRQGLGTTNWCELDGVHPQHARFSPRPGVASQGCSLFWCDQAVALGGPDGVKPNSLDRTKMGHPDVQRNPAGDVGTHPHGLHGSFKKLEAIRQREETDRRAPRRQ